MKEASETLERTIAAPAPLVWALVADTNRFDRAAGLAAGSYKFRELEDGSRERVATAKQAGFAIEWIEPAYDWIEGRFVRGARTFTAGPPKAGGFSVELVPDPKNPATSTIVKARAWVAGTGFFGFIARMIMRPKFKAALRKYLDAIQEVLKRSVKDEYTWAEEPPAAAARRALLNANTDAVASGARTPNREADFDFRARKFAQSPVDPKLRAQLIEFLQTRPDEEVAAIRPFEVARAWRADKREVLRTFLHAARAGLVELQWQINCPSCRVGAETASSLDKVGRQAHCDSCNIGYDLDFAQHVEAIFKISPSVRAVETAVYCASSPWFRPHVYAQLGIEPGQSSTRKCALPPAELLVRTLRHGRRQVVEIEDPPPKSMRIVMTDGAIEVTTSGKAEGGEDTELTIENKATKHETLLLERTGWSADIVLGSVIATFPDFLDLFATEAPAAGVELSVSSLTLLFSDLTGSTALYERVGDARAFAIVEEHFRDMAKAIVENGGAIVKTMGDAVMATFNSPAAALRAGLQMVAECERAHADLGLEVKIGLHDGPCLAVRANDKLDFFGTTVNVAARLQAQAKGSEVVIAEALLDHVEIADTIRKQGMPMRKFEASLKGIRETQKLVGIHATRRPADVSMRNPPAKVAS
ncbi:MAG: adenylate/guanylate cyclase domain-containing protein [Polyangiales bacterium]